MNKSKEGGRPKESSGSLIRECIEVGEIAEANLLKDQMK